MKYFILLLCFSCFVINAAVQYNFKGNQGWLTFDQSTTISFEVERSGKDKDHENYIDRGEGIVDYGWYNMDTGESGSFKNGLSANFNKNDKIGLYVTDNNGKTYLSVKPNNNHPFENDIWGKSKLVDGTLAIAGGDFGSNGTHEYYVFKINNLNNQPTGQPLPGIIVTLLIGLTSVFYLKNRKKLLS